jgi:hypothetical protein
MVGTMDLLVAIAASPREQKSLLETAFQVI